MKIKCNACELKIISKEEYNEYFALISNNRNRLKNYFPKTIHSVQNLEQAQKHLIKVIQKFENKEIYPFGVYKKETLIGWISIKNIDWRIPKGELGYYIDEINQGKGIIGSAVKEIIKFAFENLKMEKIYIKTGIDNIGSKKIAIKNGFQQEGILRSEFRLNNGELIDIIYFGKLRDA